MQSLFPYLQKYHGLSREEILGHLDVFFLALEEAFGPLNGKTVGRFIVKVLYVRLGLEFVDKPSRGLAEYVEEARRA